LLSYLCLIFETATHVTIIAIAPVGVAGAEAAVTGPLTRLTILVTKMSVLNLETLAVEVVGVAVVTGPLTRLTTLLTTLVTKTSVLNIETLVVEVVAVAVVIDLARTTKILLHNMSMAARMNIVVDMRMMTPQTTRHPPGAHQRHQSLPRHAPARPAN